MMFYSYACHVINEYGVATIGRILKFIGLFCKRALKKRLYSAKETYNFKAHTHRSHPIRHGHMTFEYVIHMQDPWHIPFVYNLIFLMKA